jgi:hypothetical protein
VPPWPDGQFGKDDHPKIENLQCRAEKLDWQLVAGRKPKSLRFNLDLLTPAKTQGVVDADQHCYAHPLKGNLPNRDTFVELDA